MTSFPAIDVPGCCIRAKTIQCLVHQATLQRTIVQPIPAPTAASNTLTKSSILGNSFWDNDLQMERSIRSSLSSARPSFCPRIN
ncbi:uncharacterized protein PHALS_13682 [Plasmopara halstedii]|uniref:Uncharacterized protein n=1 Tax=Plasmopara halstedii TaxID=4781 RepID=A0A0P1APM7_PLAHL|nr:uncharacterized protein PHALS_13682 [Plasmopara halstedii]CEG43489.1 hypothetical protein PHALS_13682 [Plasmopara halstedii]|eukprot:XP_024579858.1 hypothetical protein PHALS_13682 [Plasmopara halstedii]